MFKNANMYQDILRLNNIWLLKDSLFMQSGSKYQAEPMEMESESHEKDLTDNLLLKPKTTEEA